MRLLGAILAGGQSRRFGSDKAEATIGGTAMLALVASALRRECQTVVVIGRDWPGLVRIEDRPLPGLGPLGGLAGALAYAREEGVDAVLTSGCDLPALPAGLAALLAPADALLADQPTIGLWRADHADTLAHWLERTERRSINAWADHVGARRIAIDTAIANINTPADLDDHVEALAKAMPREDPRSSR